MNYGDKKENVLTRRDSLRRISIKNCAKGPFPPTIKRQKITQPTGKWETPADWLDNKIDNLTDDNDILNLQTICKHLLNLADNDQLQDLFQQEMDEDGYFK